MHFLPPQTDRTPSPACVWRVRVCGCGWARVCSVDMFPRPLHNVTHLSAVGQLHIEHSLHPLGHRKHLPHPHAHRGLGLDRWRLPRYGLHEGSIGPTKPFRTAPPHWYTLKHQQIVQQQARDLPTSQAARQTTHIHTESKGDHGVFMCVGGGLPARNGIQNTCLVCPLTFLPCDASSTRSAVARVLQANTCRHTGENTHMSRYIFSV